MKRILSLRIHQLLSLALGIIRIPFTVRKYGIKRGYRARNSYTHYDDTSATDEAQKEVYELARYRAEQHNLKRILDVGCGSGFKLVHQFDDQFETIGMEILETLTFLKKIYPNRTWLDGSNTDFSSLNAQLVICSDVIEHVTDPDLLLDNILKVNGLEYLIISTPDRLLVRGWYDFGPPWNKAHTREWSGREFANYLSTRFEVISHQVTHYGHATQVIVCRPKVSLNLRHQR